MMLFPRRLLVRCVWRAICHQVLKFCVYGSDILAIRPWFILNFLWSGRDSKNAAE